MTEKRFTIDNESDIIEFDYNNNEYIQDFMFADGKSWDRICNRLNELYEENKQLKSKVTYLKRKLDRERQSYQKQHEKWEKEVLEENEQLKQENEELKKELADLYEFSDETE